MTFGNVSERRDFVGGRQRVETCHVIKAKINICAPGILQKGERDSRIHDPI